MLKIYPLLLLIPLIMIIVLFSFDKEPVFYWSFDETLVGLGSNPVSLHNSFPVYACGLNSTRYCFDFQDPDFAQIEFIQTRFNHGVHFNGLTFLTSGYLEENKFDFLEFTHPFTIETWIVPHQLCVGNQCYHHYFLSKAFTDDNNSVTGFACGQQRDSSFYCYMRNPNEFLKTETADAFPDGVPTKFSITHDGSGTWEGIKLYINGIQVQKTI